MNRLVMLAAAAALAGCVPVTSVYDARSGETLHEINCSGPSPLSWSSCQRKADKVCPSGWSIVSTTRESQAAVSAGSDRRMTVRCRSPVSE